MRYIANPPDAGALMRTARSFGSYDLASSLADLIDNSIHAGANRVSILCDFAEGKPVVRIRDDGAGMDSDALCRAMRPASSDPTDERDKDDLGRFGWGLKSASFSQCSLLSVLSATTGQAIHGAVWDLTDIHGWRMGILSEVEAQGLASKDFNGESGTEVVWQRCDRLSEEGRISAAEFNQILAAAEQRLALVFHKYLSGDAPARRISISLNGQDIESFDPMCRDHPATQQEHTESVDLPGGRIVIRPYVLPHFGKMTLTQQRKLGGDEGFVRNQGFYVYRNGRLLISGTWFNLARHGDLSQLMRIEIEIPNTLDGLWKITVDKSAAQLPPSLRTRLKALVQGYRLRSVKTITARGGRLDTPGITSVWNRRRKSGEVNFSINRRHPLVSALYSGQVDSSTINAALSLIEQNMPTKSVIDVNASVNDELAQCASDAKAVIDQLSETVRVMRTGNIAEEQIADLILRTEPFSSHKELVVSWLDNTWRD